MVNTRAIILFLGFVFSQGSLIGQQLPSARDWESYYQVVGEREAHFAQSDRGKGSGFKQYMRWRGQMAYRVGNDGVLKNFESLNLNAFQRMQSVQANQRSPHGDWENLGPFDYTVSSSNSGGGIGRLNCLAFHPTNSAVIWVGAAAGGLWKSTDSGINWAPQTDAFGSIGISSIAVNHLDPNTIYLLTGDGDGSNTSSIGVLKTTDGGSSWTTTGMQFGVNQFNFGYKLLMHPTNPDTLFAAMRNTGIFRTLDGGSNWVQVYAGATVWDLEFKPGSPDTIYAGSTDGFLVSTNNGATWIPDNDPSFPSPIDTISRMAIAISPSQPDNVYAVFGGQNGINGFFYGAYKSTNSGSSFVMTANTPNILDASMNGDVDADQAGYDLAMIVDPLDDSKVYVAGVNCWKSVDGGVNWQRKTWWTRANAPADPYAHADWHDLNFLGDTLFAANDGGIYKTSDAGDSWTELSAGLSIMQFYEIDVYDSSYLGGTQDNGTNGADVSNPQTHNNLGGDGFGCVWHTGDHTIQYMSSQSSVARRQFGSNVFIWDEANQFWNTDIAMHTTNPDYIFLDKGPELVRGNQDGAIWNFNWDSLGTAPLFFTLNEFDDESIMGYAQGINNPEVMYVVNRSRIIKTTNLSSGSPTWDTLPNPVFGIATFSDVEIDPLNANRVWVVCGGYSIGNKAFFSSNGGTTWTNISAGLPNVPMRCLSYHAGSNDGIYIGSEIGVFFKDAAVTDWLFFSTYLPNTIVNDIQISDGYVYAGTYGRGLWRSEVFSCPVNLTLTPANDPNPLSIGKRQFNATNTITSTRVIQGGFADVTYTAANYTDLTPGFWVKKGNAMIVKVAGCPF